MKRVPELLSILQLSIRPIWANKGTRTKLRPINNYRVIGEGRFCGSIINDCARIGYAHGCILLMLHVWVQLFVCKQKIHWCIELQKIFGYNLPPVILLSSGTVTFVCAHEHCKTASRAISQAPHFVHFWQVSISQRRCTSHSLQVHKI